MRNATWGGRIWIRVAMVAGIFLSGCGEEEDLRVGSTEEEDPRVGSTDCAVLGDEWCTECLGQSCDGTEDTGAIANGCALFPCVDGARVVQGCSTDSDCGAFEGYWCGMGTSPHSGLCGLDMGNM